MLVSIYLEDFWMNLCINIWASRLTIENFSS
jgi:hypothetical protein